MGGACNEMYVYMGSILCDAGGGYAELKWRCFLI